MPDILANAEAPPRNRFSAVPRNADFTIDQDWSSYSAAEHERWDRLFARSRAVFFSALMTVTAFGSLWVSGNPGISSMGKLLMLSLACTLASAALFQPALMGRPRAAKPE